MSIQTVAATPPVQPGIGGAGAGNGKASGATGSSSFASLIGGQQGSGAPEAATGSAAAPDQQTTSLLGLLQMLQTMLAPLQNQLPPNADSAGQQGTQELPLLLLQAMNGNPGFAEQLRQDPGVQAWLSQASAVIQAIFQPSGSSSIANLPIKLSDPSKLTFQNTLLQLATLGDRQPDNPILAHLLGELQRAVEPLLAANGTAGNLQTAARNQAGNNAIVQQIVVESNGEDPLQQTKSRLEMLAAKTSGITAAQQQPSGGAATADSGGSQSSSSDSSLNQTPTLPLQDLLKTLQQTEQVDKSSALATINAQTFVRDMSDYMVKNMKLTLGDAMKEAKLSLNPEHLGQIDVKITLHASGQLVAQLTADTSAGRQLLESQLPQLRQTLQSQGLHVERLEVAQQAETASNLFQQQRQGQGGGQPFSRKQSFRMPEIDAADGDFADDLRTLADMRRNGGNGGDSDSSFDVTA